MTGRIHGQTADVLRRALIEARHGRRVAVVTSLTGESYSRSLLTRIAENESVSGETLKLISFVSSSARPASMRGLVNNRILFDHNWHRGLAGERMREWNEAALGCNQREIDE